MPGTWNHSFALLICWAVQVRVDLISPLSLSSTSVETQVLSKFDSPAVFLSMLTIISSLNQTSFFYISSKISCLRSASFPSYFSSDPASKTALSILIDLPSRIQLLAWVLVSFRAVIISLWRPKWIFLNSFQQCSYICVNSTSGSGILFHAWGLHVPIKLSTNSMRVFGPLKPAILILGLATISSFLVGTGDYDLLFDSFLISLNSP